VVPSVFDKIVSSKTLANDGGGTYTFGLRKNLIYKGKVAVTNGTFHFSFIVPKDIAYRFDTGKISYYATDSVTDATGSYGKVIVGGSLDDGIMDETGPEIKLFMNNLLFRDGGITDPNPWLIALVSDESGINTIGSGIGHDITAILDGNTDEPYILNDFYESDFDTYKSGYIRFPFSLLSSGEHTLVVKVWDVFNNSSEATINFTVYSSGELVISNTYCYPNPFENFTDIIFEHNQQDIEMTVKVEIYSLTGQFVTRIEQTSEQGGSVSTPVRWNGCNSNGAQMPSGMYLYNLSAFAPNGLFARSGGKIIYHRP
jgi:hypothetical protein